MADSFTLSCGPAEESFATLPLVVRRLEMVNLTNWPIFWSFVSGKANSVDGQQLDAGDSRDFGDVLTLGGVTLYVSSDFEGAQLLVRIED